MSNRYGRYGGFGYSRSYTPKHQAYTGPSRATIMQSSRKGWYDISTPFNADFVDKLKALIPGNARTWNKESKMWSVIETHLEDAVNLLKLYYAEVITTIGQEKEQDTGNMFARVFEAMKGLPKENVDKTYKALATALHPDHGGSNELMMQLNQAYQEHNKTS